MKSWKHKNYNNLEKALVKILSFETIEFDEKCIIVYIAIYTATGKHLSCSFGKHKSEKYFEMWSLKVGSLKLGFYQP